MAQGLADTQNLKFIILGKDAKFQKGKIYMKDRDVGPSDIMKEA